MDFTSMPNSSFNDESWLYNNNLSELKSSYNNETLQEPVPFEDFKFSFGMNPDFSNPPPSMMDPFLQDPFNFMPAANTVLDENDQKAFSSFLDTFFMDPDMQFQPSTQPNFYEFESSSSPQQQQQQQEEEYRRNSILQSLDEQKLLHQRLNLIASLPTAHTNTITTTTKSSTTPGDQCRNESSSIQTDSVTSEEDNMPQSIYLRQSDSISSPYINKKRSSSVAQLYSSSPSSSSHSNSKSEKKARTNKELLTEEEKRANHIASEQKRRSTIRNGFKELTDLIPTLKNINNSKSTVLFKAVDFIRYLEKRNKGLKEKVGSLELRVQVEGRMTQSNNNNTTTTTSHHKKPQMTSSIIHRDEEPIKKMIIPPSPPITSIQKKKRPFMNNPINTNHLQGLPVNARNALLAHKTQQKQLLILQEQLQMHQRLIAQQQELKEKNNSSKNKLAPILGKYDKPSSLLKELEDNAISAP